MPVTVQEPLRVRHNAILIAVVGKYESKQEHNIPKNVLTILGLGPGLGLWLG